MKLLERSGELIMEHNVNRDAEQAGNTAGVGIFLIDL